MGNSSGSYTVKAAICSQLYSFSKWGSEEMREFLIRGQSDLPETFGLRKHEFEFILGKNDEISFKTLRSLFDDIFDTDRNGLVDKFEVMSVICMVSKLSTQDKIHFFFELFNFNNKGYLNESELTLLVMAVTRGVYKVDQKFPPPSVKTVKALVTEALEYAEVDPNTIRKPELVRFAVGNADVSAYLECWRGHASQVLLLDGFKWKDLSFPCNETAILPSFKWFNLSLPPIEFVHWRRKDRVGTELGCEHLFAHEVSYLKTIDRRVVYKGDGIIGTGYLKQGFLADLWFLNGISAIIANPTLVLSCFGETGQEDQGRYCCRFFEGGSWRSVYVDDRIPCAADHNALFASSSCTFEAWPMIIQKACAKYFGSYGHIAWAAQRSDSSLMAMRMLTGGHVIQYHVAKFDWKSVIEESTLESGTKMVIEYLREGSIVTFGRSAPQSMMSISMKQNKATFNLPPIGHTFPVVGFNIVKGYVYLILKDNWGLIGDLDENVNFESGRCNTFQIKVEDIPLFYDCMIVCRYPDSLRPKAEYIGLKPWITEAANNICAEDTPAKFLLVVDRNIQDSKPAARNRLGSKLDKINEVLTSSNKIENKDDFNIPRLKDKIEFSRENDRPMPGGKKDDKEGDNNNPEKTKNLILEKIDEKSDLINVCFTASSCCDWSYAGSKDVDPVVKIRIVPSLETKRAIRIREEEIVIKKRTQQDYMNKRRMAQAKLLDVNAADQFQQLIPPSMHQADNDLESKVSGSQATNTSSFANLSKQSEPSSILSFNPNIEENKQYELIFTAERNWFSQSIELIPGEYMIFVSIEYNKLSYKEIRKRSLPRDLSEAPWVDPKLAQILLHEDKPDQFSQTANYLKNIKDDDSRSLTSLKELEKKLFQQRSNDLVQDQLRREEEERNALLQHKVWLEASTLQKLQLKPIPANIPFNSSNFHFSEHRFAIADPIFPDYIEKDCWPFAVESQAEVSSMKLYSALTNLRDEAEYLAEDFITIVRKYKEERKQEMTKAQGKNTTTKKNKLKKDEK